ncbi:MAG: sulfatase-like hydrolase/transferase [Bryobacteraceae bacterium]
MLPTRRALIQSLLAQRSTPRYNLLLITADNLGYGDLGCYGNTEIKTPNFDAFARQGVRFTNFYTSSPTCTASRAGLLTGRHPIRFGLNYQLSTPENKSGVGLPHSEKILPQYLGPLGYATGAFGKWNLGWAPGSRPTERGFDEFLGHRSGNIDYYTHIYNGDLDLYRNTAPARLQGYSVDLFADAAMRFMNRHSARPWLTYLPFNSPHFPNPKNKVEGESNEWQAPDAFFAEYGYSPREQDPRKRYRAVVTALDHAFGRVVDSLNATGQSDRTLVFFYSDNGAFMLPGRGLEVQTNRPLRDGGVTCFEGGIRVAGMARWPRHIPPASVTGELLSAHDVLPLALSLAGASLPTAPTYDGIDPLPALTGKGPGHRSPLFFEYQKHQAVRDGKWKLVRASHDAPWELYDLDADIGETRNIAAAWPRMANSLAAQFQRWRESAAAPKPQGPGQ